MHILVVSQYFWPENFRINDLVKEWVSRGHQVTVLTGKPNYPSGKVFDAYRKRPDAFNCYESARLVRVPMFPRGSGSAALILNYLSFVVGASLSGAWDLRDVQPDVIFVFEPSPVTVGLPAVWLGQIKKVPVILWALDLWPETLAAVGVIRSPRILSWVGYMVRYIYDRCELVLGQSRSFLDNIGNYCSDKTKIRYFPSWAEDVFFQVDVTPAPEVPEFKNGFTILFAGNIGEAQDMPTVLDAIEQLRENSAIRWVFVGDGRKSEWLFSEVVKRSLQHCVLLPGRFSIERMPSFYAHADALFVSLKRDPVFSMTIPGKVQSYLMAGVPIIGMLDGEGAQVILAAQAGEVCAAGDSFGLAQAVKNLSAKTVEERQQLGLNGRNYAQKEFGRNQLVNQLENMFREAIDGFKSSSTAGTS